MEKLFYKIALFEGISYLLFGVTMPLKYWMNIAWPNKIIGMLHGILFVGYIIIGYVISTRKKWTPMKKVQLYLASIIPFGTFIFIKK